MGVGGLLKAGEIEQKREKDLDMHNSVVIAGGEGGIRGLSGNGKNTTKIKLFKKYYLRYFKYYKIA